VSCNGRRQLSSTLCRGSSTRQFRRGVSRRTGGGGRQGRFQPVSSCLAFGTGSGEHEIGFARRLLPNLRSFTAVEPDPDSVEALRTSFRDGQLPGVETSVVETSLESWNGVDSRVDAVLLFNVLGHVLAADRDALLQKLTTRHLLSRAALVVVCVDDFSVPNGNVLLMERLGVPRVDYDELEAEMLAAGFRVVFERALEIRLDYSNPSDDLVRFIQLMAEHKFSELEVRKTVDDIYSQPNLHTAKYKLAIFTK